ncbi:MAG: hypothetical protein IJW15_01900 [Clostridia bacterium]|nr:hypothetical protein [Clostridia bacterium]
MRVEHPRVLEIMRLGECGNSGPAICGACGKDVEKFGQDKVVDRFGRTFCNEKCKKRFYSRY